MKVKKIILLLLVAVLAGCGAPKNILSYKKNAETVASQGNYSASLEAWKQYFNQQNIDKTEGQEFAEAAKVAYLAGDLTQAVSWFDQARYKNYADAEMYLTLAKIYKSQHNLSKELSALEYLVDNFSNNSKEVYDRLFELYIEIDDIDKAMQVWKNTDDNFRNKLETQKILFSLNRKQDNKIACDSLSLIILEKEPENVEALEWNATKYYWQGENLYQQEMDKYNKNKTTKQYKVLLNALDTVTADFKKAIPYFEKLWKMNPGEKYAGYMANIYARFGDEKKADYYKKFIK